MTDRLKKLKEDMDDTVLNGLDFREKNKVKVRKTFVTNHDNVKHNRRINLGFVLSLCFTTLFIGSASYILVNNTNISEEDSLTKETDVDVIADNDQKSLQVSHPEPKENYEKMTKEEILHKLFNSVDYFETAAGKFEVYERYYDGSSSKETVEYKMSNKGVIGGYEKIINHPDPENPQTKQTTQETYYNSNQLWHLKWDLNQYSTKDYEPEEKRPVVKAEDIFNMDPDDIFEFDSRKMYRESPPSLIAFSSLFNYTFVAKFLRYENEWTIEKQNEELLGHNTLVIYGRLDDSLVNIMQPEEKDFRIWIDKDTGIIVKREVYNEAGELVSYLHPSNLVINETYLTDEFEPELEEYQEERRWLNPPPQDKRESELEVIEHADTKLSKVKEVMVDQRETMPLFFEFANSKITPFSASIEKYQEDYQAFVVYSYDKPETEQGSGSRLLYTRIYPKDTYLRKTGDFDRPLGDEIEALKVNGIQWRIYKVQGTDDVHVKGELDEHILELVTHDVSFDETKRLLSTFQKVK
ncbi:hypothetical protein FZC79_15035 [Rossellomorea vietnamensis]|uniref:MucB/RseB N-terminal domain-containing protein n=1 Tax=Rossellomorea vietnamensis TaxID=218284 RepID=A0A5D4KCK2_9BACI|nr:hypothetical protein [Rossellomorea vietnamensis]TYR74395.1 hypothetical protein FZC79_15035 [Rossellomorea vietnamensis]